MSFLFIPLACPTFLKYARTNTQYHKERLPEATSWCLAIVEVDIEYTDAALISIQMLHLSAVFIFLNYFFKETSLHSSKWIVLYIRSSEWFEKQGKRRKYSRRNLVTQLMIDSLLLKRFFFFLWRKYLNI